MELIRKAPLAKEIARIIEERGLTQTKASHIVKNAPPQLSLMVTGKSAGFSTERLLRRSRDFGATSRSPSANRPAGRGASAFARPKSRGGFSDPRPATP